MSLRNRSRAPEHFAPATPQRTAAREIPSKHANPLKQKDNILKSSVAAASTVVLSVLLTAGVTAQPPGRGASQNGRATPGFDRSRFVPLEDGVFEPFHVTETQSLRSALDAGLVSADTSVLVTHTGRSRLALLMEQMAFHHVAQGRTDGQHWLVSFCVVCNTGTRLVPIVGGKPAHFTPAGAYDAMLVMRDVETGTLWNHITGEALDGPRVGSSLGPAGNALQMNVGRALAMDPKVRVAISDRMYFAAGRLHGTARGFLVDTHDNASSRNEAARQASIRSTRTAADPRAVLSDVFASTLGVEDRRRSRMDLGLGIWSGVVSRFYPLEQIRQSGGAIIDRINGRRVLVHVDPEVHIPVALFVESTRARMDGA